LQQQRDELLVVRHRRKDLRRRHRDVQKKIDPVGVAAPSQRVRDRDQVIVVHPDQVVLPDYFFELGREMIIDPEISAEIPTRELSEIKPVMQNRPQHTVGEAVVIFLVVVVGQVGDGIFDVLVLDGMRFQLACCRDPAAPAKPDAAVPLKRRPQRDFEPACALDTIAGRNRNAVGNDH